MSGVFKQSCTMQNNLLSYLTWAPLLLANNASLQDKNTFHPDEVTEISAESLSLDLDSLGASSTSVLFSANNGKIFSAVRQKLRYFATSMLPVGPDGPDEKPLSPRDSNPEVTPSSPPQPTPVEGPPRPPFSCVPVYIAILAILALIILIGGVNAVLQLKPELIYGNSTESIDYFNHTLVL